MADPVSGALGGATAGPWGALAGFGGGLLGSYLGGKEETKYRRLARKRGQYSIDERMRPLLDLYFGKQMAALQSGRGEIEKGYADAETQVSLLGRGAMRDAKDAGLQAGGRLASGLVSSGLHGTSVRGNLARGVQSDVTRRIAEITEQMAGLRSNLYVNRGQDLAQADAGIAGLYGNRLGHELDLENLRYGLFTGYQPQGQSAVDAGGLGNLVDEFSKYFNKKDEE